MLCKSFVQVLKAWDESETFFYLDPPALRSIPIEDTAEPLELSVEDHMNLIHLAKNSKAKVMISGYSCPLYNRSLKNWKCKKKTLPATQVKTKDRRIECVWFNY